MKLKRIIALFLIVILCFNTELITYATGTQETKQVELSSTWQERGEIQNSSSAFSENEPVVFNNHRYQVVKESVTWQEAKKRCEAAGGHLVTITSAEENEFVTGLLSSYTRYWIGLSNGLLKDIWRWVTNETSNYSNWEIKEPDNYYKNEYYVYYYNGKWIDANDKVPHYYICEWDDYIISDIIANDNPFELGKHNNNFIHTNLEDYPGAGFVDLKDYHISERLYDKLVKSSSDGEKDLIKRKMSGEWGGSCYGIVSTMALAFLGKLDLSLFDNDSEFYHDMDYPSENKAFLDAINYYQLSQHLQHGGQKSAAIDYVYNGNLFTDFIGYILGFENKLHSFLEHLVFAANTNEVLPFTYSTENGGHAILVCGSAYDKEKKSYVLKLYDENVVSGKDDNGYFADMIIAEDYSEFSFETPGDDIINQQTFDSLYFLDVNNIYNEKPYPVSSNKISNNSKGVKIKIPIGIKFELQNYNGKILKYDGSSFTGDMEIYDISTIVAGKNSEWLISIEDSISFTFKPSKNVTYIDIYNNNKLIALEGQNIDSADISFEKGIEMNGKGNYSFKAYISLEKNTEDKENQLISINATTSGQANIYNENGKIKVSSEKDLHDIETASYLKNKTTDKKIEETIKNFTISSEDGKVSASTPKVAQNINVKNKINKIFGNKPFNLNAKAQDKLSYSSSNKKVATINSNGKVTIKSPGKTVITMKAASTFKYLESVKKISLIVRPNAVKLLSVKSNKTNTIIVNWKKDKKSTGYEIVYAKNRKCTDGKKKIRVSNNGTVKKKVLKLKKGKRYYVKVRAYKLVNGKKLYGTYSKIRSVKVK